MVMMNSETSAGQPPIQWREDRQYCLNPDTGHKMVVGGATHRRYLKKKAQNQTRVNRMKAKKKQVTPRKVSFQPRKRKIQQMSGGYRDFDDDDDDDEEARAHLDDDHNDGPDCEDNLYPERAYASENDSGADMDEPDVNSMEHDYGDETHEKADDDDDNEDSENEEELEKRMTKVIEDNYERLERCVDRFGLDSPQVDLLIKQLCEKAEKSGKK